MKWQPSKAGGSTANGVPKPLSTPSPAERPLRVLLVEDNRDLRLAIREVFTARGFEVDSTASGDAAIDMAYRLHYDVLLSDIRLPGLNGISLARSVRSFSDATRVLLMTAFPEWSVYSQAKEAGAEEVLEKPLDLNALAEKVSGYARAV